jgi:hypothetical protein
VELLNGTLRHTPIVVVDEGEPSRPAGVAVGRNDNLNRIADGSEVLPDVDLGRTIGEVPDE